VKFSVEKERPCLHFYTLPPMTTDTKALQKNVSLGANSVLLPNQKQAIHP
jgi:hypothetical protein